MTRDPSMPQLQAICAQRPGRLARLSMEGLRHAWAMNAPSVAAVAAGLYAWNRLPSSAWRRVSAEPSAIRATAVKAAGADWTNVSPGPPASAWCAWRPRGATAPGKAPAWKVYVSPQPRHLAEAVAAAMAACAGLPVVNLKFGTDANGLLRPDKLVVHLTGLEAVVDLGARLLRRLDGCPAQGAPFTAELGGDGLVSWARDPPAGSYTGEWSRSWRGWLTWRLAEALIARRHAGAATAVDALEDIAAAGVDPFTWAPRPRLWAEPAHA